MRMLLPASSNTLRTALIIASISTAVDAYAAPRLMSPWDKVRVRVTDAPYSCPAMATVPVDLTMDGFYRLDDPTHSIIDPLRQAAYNKASEAVKGTALKIVDAADDFRQTGSRTAALCVLHAANTLAAGNSMTGKMSSGQAYYVQGWVAGAIAIAYLKVRGYGLSSAQDDAKVGAWLKRVAEQTKGFYSNATKGEGNRNNHFYWAGIELAAIGVVANDKTDWDWGLQTYADGVGRIQPDGTLPLEMQRGVRALHYHLYALAPLVLLAEFGEANGTEMYASNDGAIHRLVKTSVGGIADPSIFVHATGLKQEIAEHPSGDQIGWAPPYQRRFPDPVLKSLIEHANTLSVFYLGGLPPP
jgi:poly(beta-D-mannuronate) lyase